MVHKDSQQVHGSSHLFSTENLRTYTTTSLDYSCIQPGLRDAFWFARAQSGQKLGVESNPCFGDFSEADRRAAQRDANVSRRLIHSPQHSHEHRRIQP